MDTMYCHEHGDITTHDDECPLCLVANLEAQVAELEKQLTDWRIAKMRSDQRAYDAEVLLNKAKAGSKQ